jgi:hypothetical protein
MDRRSLAGAFKKLTRESKWEQAGAVHLNFLTGHPQGMVKIADDFYFSTVVRRKDASVYLTEEELAASGEARGFGFMELLLN